MKLSAVQVGLRLKSYRELCTLLEEPVKGGDSKKAQLKEWGRYFSYEQQGNTFIIKEVYPVPLPSEDGRAKYLRCIEPILFSVLAEYGGEHETTMRQWGIDLGIFDANIYDEEQQEQFVLDYGVDSYTFQRTVNDAAELFKKAFISALNALQKKKLLTYEAKLYMVNASGLRHLASAEEKRTYEALQSNTMTSLGSANMWVLHASKAKTKLYYERLRDAMLKQYGWANAYTLFCVVAEEDCIAQYEAVDTRKLKKELRATMRRAINDRAETNESQNMQKVLDAWESDPDKKVFQLPAWYASTTSLIFDEFMQW